MAKMLRLISVIAAIAALAALIAGCGGGSSSTSGGGGGGTVESEATETTAAEEVVDPGDLKTGGEATVAAAQGIGQLDPYKILYSFESVAHTMMYSALTRYTIDGGEEVQPDLAESWKASNGFRSYTFKIRPGMKMSNGKPLESKVIKASLERAFDPETVFLWVIFLPELKSIEAPDPGTLKMTFAEPARTLPEAMTKIPVEDVATLDQIDRDPVVTGPYKVAHFVPDQELVLEPNDQYYGEAPKLEKVTIAKAQDNTAAFTSLGAGEIQALWSIPWTDVRQVDSGGSEVEVLTGSEPVQNVILMTDYKHGVFTNVKARQALAYAVDRESVLKAIYAERGIVPETNDPVPAWSPFAKQGLPKYEFNLEKAKKLFEEAGIGPDTQLTFWAPSGQYTEWTSIGEVLQSDLKSIGISMKIETNEISQFAARFAPAGKSWPNLIIPNIYGGLPVSLIPDWWAPGVCECNFDNAQYNAALSEMQAAPTDAGFQTAIGKAQQIFNEEVPSTVVVQTSVPVGHVSDLKDIWIDPTGDTHFANAGYVK
ncbi:MAG: ABC transporter substrate-binding protein [Solirubrobacterales bacterium]